MSKVAAYLQEHILGEVAAQPAVLEAMSRDASVLEMTPELVVFPRVTNDIRKVARFCWQLAEKGHIIPITARGGGSDQTGAAIGKGIVVSMPAHMNHMFELDAKQKLVRVQPGANIWAVNEALRLHGLSIPAVPASAQYSTVGGAVANNASGLLSGRYGATSEYVYELEVVLANGEVLQTGRISRRELDKKKGLQTFEGEIYRSIDNLIEDNKELIATKLGGDVRDNAGYDALTKVKQKDGSFDLTPLLVGSQGTLGIISEMIMKTEFVPVGWGVVVASFSSTEVARDMLDKLREFEPTILNYYDSAIFDQAIEQGRQYEFYNDDTKAVAVIAFDDFSERARTRKLKKVTKLFNEADVTYMSADGEEFEGLLSVCDVTGFALAPTGKGVSAPPIVDGAYVPPERLEDFSAGLATLAVRHRTTLPLYGRVLDDTYYARPTLQLQKVGDKQKVFKLLDEYSDLVVRCGGHLIGESGEGRVKARFAYKTMDEDVLALFAKVKSIFDPYGIMNPGVKQAGELKQLVASLRSEYDHTAFLPHVPRI